MLIFLAVRGTRGYDEGVKLPKRLRSPNRQYLPQTRSRSILLDAVKASDLNHLELRFFCEDCSHYVSGAGSGAGQCTLGYPARHTKREQLALHEVTGRMALCRAIEID